MRAEQLTGPVAYHGEGPVWSPRGAACAGSTCSPATCSPSAMTARSAAAMSACRRRVRPRAPGRRGHRRRAGLRPRGRRRRSDTPDRAVGRRRRADERGRLRSRRPLLLRLDGLRQAPRRRHAVPAGARRLVAVVLNRVTVSNGLEWSPDGTHAYYNDTAPTADRRVRLRPRVRPDRAADLRDRSRTSRTSRRADRRRRRRRLGGPQQRRRGAALLSGRACSTR